MKRMLSFLTLGLIMTGLVLAAGNKRPPKKSVSKGLSSRTLSKAALTNPDSCFLAMGPGFNAEVAPGGTDDADYGLELFNDDFEWYSPTFERCCNFWEVTAILNFDGYTEPITTIYRGELDSEADDIVGYNGTLWSYPDASMSDSAFLNLGYREFEMQEASSFGDTAKNVEVLAMQFSDPSSESPFHYVTLVVENDNSTALTGGTLTLFADIDAAEGWWMDEEFQEYGDDWDAYWYNSVGKTDSLIYQYFNPAVIDTNEDGTPDYSGDPVIYIGMGLVSGGNGTAPSFGNFEDWWTLGGKAAIGDIVSGAYQYDPSNEDIHTDWASYITVNLPDLAAGARDTVTFAFVGGETLNDLLANQDFAVDNWNNTFSLLLSMGPGYNAAVAAGGTEDADYSNELFNDDFEWYSPTFERCCNFWEVTALLNFDGFTEPTTTIYRGELDTEAEDIVGYNGNLHVYPEAVMTSNDLGALLTDTDFELQEYSSFGDASKKLEVLAMQFSNPSTKSPYHYITLAVKNDNSTTLTGGTMTLFADIDAAEGWWMDEEFQEYGDDWDAYWYNSVGKTDSLIYQYFNPAIIDTNEDGTADYSGDPVIYIGMGLVSGGNGTAPSFGNFEDWWTLGGKSALADIVNDVYAYDVSNEDIHTDWASYITVNLPDMEPGQVEIVTFSFVGGESIDDLLVNQNNAEAGWGGITLNTIEERQALPFAFKLHQNYPNPFNPETNIRFELEKNSLVVLEVYDLKGRVVKQLASKPFNKGVHEIVWNGTNNSGKPVSSGMYMTRLTVNGQTSINKMLLVR